MSLRRLSTFALALGLGALGAPAAHAAPPPPALLVEGALCDAAGACGAPTLAFHRALHAGPAGATLRLGNGMRLRFDAGAAFNLGPSVPIPTAPGATLRAPVVVLHRGRVRVRASQRAEPAAVVFRGPHSTSALVRAGEAALRAREEGLSLGVTSSPGAMLAAGNAWSDCPENTVCSAPNKHASVSRRPTIEPPAPTVRALAAAAVDGRALAPTLRWRPMDDASLYEVRVARSPDLSDPLRSVETRATEAALVDLAEAGTYWAGLRAFDAEGLPGRWGPPARVRVAGVETPKGALVAADGAIALPPGSRLRLSGAEGMRVGTEGVRDEFDAPAELGVGRGGARPLRLREPGGDEGVALRLAARTLRVAVDIGPKTAHWPGDPVLIRVRLLDGEGRPLPADFPINVEATYDLQPLTLRWERAGDVMTAVVPPRVVTSPGVVRAEVNDGQGLSLGRASLEIVPSARFLSAAPAR